jgi:purine-binding chemotaxis protein CheW
MTSATTMTHSHRNEGNQAKFLTFFLGQEEYGVEILRVREIIGLLDITPLPQVPDFVKGVINLRGRIIPVIELRAKFSMSSKPYDDETCIVVVEIEDEESGDEVHIGVIVDAVSEVRRIPASDTEPAPRFGVAVHTNCILGIGKVKRNGIERVTILLDIDKVLSIDDLNRLGEVTARADDAHPNADSVTQIAA